MMASKLILPLAMGLAVPAAGGAQGTSRVVVRADDLDLSRTADARRLGRRIKIAIRKICDQPGTDPLALYSERLCRRSAMIAIEPPYRRM
ncbi:UrcA family protein [Sphingobium lactosutens]|uniref:UrcA family protein n=1 Tax=Sphingobium lactosutens TaxID=522773 RepID=UPI0015C175C7|nr:UrcA family protein [Sphingobium lactosutens]